MMKKTLLFILLLGISPLFVFAQSFEDLCASAEAATSEAMTDGDMITVTAFGAATDDPAVDPNSCSGPSPVADVFFNFNVPSTGYWELVIDGTTASASGSYCAAIGLDCANMDDLLEDIDFTSGETTATCQLLTGGTDYILAFYIESGGDVDIELTVNSAEPTNDVCDAGNNVLLVSGAVENGTTACATDDANFACALNPEDHVVYYDYTTGSTYSDVIINLETNGATDVGMMIWTDCGGTAYDNGGSPVQQCSAGTDIELLCVPPNTAFVIAVGSADGDDGGFDLTLSETANTVVNDMCVNATAEILATDCTLTNIAGDNTGACPEDNVSACTGSIPYDSNPVTWHSFTMPTGASDLILDAILSGSIEISIFDDCPDNGGNSAGGTSCVSATPTTFSGLTAGNTYYIGVASSAGSEGPYDFDLLAVVPPDNDDCVNAEDLSGGSLSGETNSCASAETGEPFGGCGGSSDDATVWYEYDVTSDIQDITINLTSTGSSGIIDNYLIAYDACGGNMIEEDCGGTEVIIDCPVNGSTIWIQVGSEFADAGDFDISVTEGVAAISNDLCSGAEDITPDDICVFETASGTVVDMCPEVDGTGTSSDLGSLCNFSDESTSWYSFLTTGNTTQVEFDNFTSGVFITIFTDCPATSIVTGGNCINVNTTITVMGNTTYYIAATTGTVESAFTFDIKFKETPDNDLCANAEVFTMTTAPGNTFVGESTVCATSDLFGICDPNATSSVWYTYTVPIGSGGHNELTIDVTNYSATTGSDNFNLFAINGACGSTTLWSQTDGTNADYCGGSGTDLISIPCLDEGDVISIVVASDSNDEGSFDITINDETDNASYDAACLDNDLCANVDNSLGTITTNDAVGEMCITDCNTLACPDDEIDALCGATINNAVFFEFTTDNDPLLSDGTQVFLQVNINNSCGSLSLAVLSGSCGSYMSFTPIGCIATDDSGNVDVTGVIQPNTTYTIVVGTNDNVGCANFDLCVQITTGCANDDCVNAITTTDGVLLASQNTGCTMDATTYNCGAEEASSAWYAFTMPVGMSTMTIDISGGSFSVQVFDGTNGCPPGTVDLVTDGQFCDFSGTEDITCLQENTLYYIQVSTTIGSEVMFDITVTGSVPENDHDLCTTPDPIVNGPDCMFFTFCADFDAKPCPEASNFGTACNFNTDPVVWASITLPANAVGLEFQNFDDTGAYAALFNNTCPATNTVNGSPCFSSASGLTTINGLTPGNTYNLALGNSNAESFCFDIKLITPPAGDEPCDTNGINDDDVVDLGSGGSNSNTTCCATVDYLNVQCSVASNSNTVWYTFQPDPNADGVSIVVNSGTATGLTAEVYGGNANAGCSGALNFIDSECSETSFEIRIPTCIGDAPVLWVKIGSSNDQCGTFDITIENVASECAPQSDECEDALSVPSPVTDCTGATLGTEGCITSCLDLACPEGTYTDCGQAMNGTVWFQVDTDACATQMLAEVVPNGSWTPEIVIYQGTDCTNLVPVANFINTGSNCATLVGGNASGQYGVLSDATYWIAVSGSGNLDNSGFELCVQTTINLITCLQQDQTDFMVDGEIVGGVGWDADDPLNQLCAGQEYEVCMDFDYDASQSQNDWLHGVIPQFGNGWDISTFDPNNATINPPASTAPGGQAVAWYDNAILQEPVPNICVFTNSEGNLEICNELVQACPCAAGMMPGDLLPPGWFWLATGGAGCANDGTPGTHFGIGSGQVSVSICFDITVKEFNSEADCLAQNDLTISFMPFSDGVAGCWEDASGECAIDYLQFVTMKSNCNFPPVILVDGAECGDMPCEKEICTGSMVDVLITLGDNSTTPIDIVFNSNGTTVTGGMDHNFNGSGTIDDLLINSGTTDQTVIYEITVNDPNSPCLGPTTELEVTVYPELLGEEDYEVCQNSSPIDICVNPIGGSGNYVSFDWSNGESTECWIFDPSIFGAGTYNYTVLVTDDLGCSGTIDVEVTVHQEVLFTMDPVNFCLTTDQNMCEGIIELPFITSGTPPYDYFWTVSPSTGIQLEQDNFTDELIIDLCNSFDGTFTVTLEVEDGNQCFYSQEFDLELAAAPLVNITLTDPPCDDGSGNQQYDIDVISTFPFPLIEVFDASGTSVAGPIPGTGNDVVSVIGSGTYTFIMTEVIAGCINEQEFIIDPPAATLPIISANPNPICIGDETTIMVDNGAMFASFEWSDSGMSAGSSITTDTISANTTYVVTATDNDGCAATAAIDIEVNPLPIAQISGSLSYCTGSSTSLTGSGGATYSWMLPGGGSSADNPLMVSTAGNYILEVTDVNGCISTSDVDVIEDANLNPQIAGGDICDGSAIDLDAGSGFDSYTWEGPSGALGSMQLQAISAGGTYSVTVEDATGCTGIGMFTVNEFQTPVVNATTADVCNNDETGASTIFDLATLYPGIQGNYFDPAGVVLASTIIDADGIAAQTQVYTFTTSTATLPCMDATAQISINIIECICPPVIVDPGTELCSSDALYNLQNLEQAAIADGFWSYNGDVLMNDLFDPSIGAGTYEVVFTLDPANQGDMNCDPTATAEIVVSQAVVLEPNMGPFDVCNTDESGSLTTIDLGDYFTGSDVGVWTDVNGDPVAGVIDYYGIAEGTVFTYTYTTTGAVDPCENDSATLTFEVIDCTVPPCPDPMLSDADACTSQGIFNINSTIGDPAVTGFWLDANGNQINGIIDVSTLSPGPYMYSFVLQPSPAAGCDTSFPLTLNVYTVTIQPDAVADVCNSDFSGASTIIDLGNYFTASDAGVWTDSNGNVVAGMQDFDGEPVGDQFVFTYTTTTAIAPCVNQSATLTITVLDCECPNPLLVNPSTACNDDDMVDLATTIGNPAVTGFWLDLDGNQFDGIVDVTLLDVAVYEFTYVLDPVPPAGCDETFPLSLDVISQNNPGVADPDVLRLCEGDVQQIQLPSLIDPASNPDVGGTWQDDPANSYNGTPFNPNLATFDPVDQDPGTYIFTYGWYNNMPCEDVFTIITIIIDPNPVADAGMGGELNCDNSETGVLLDGSGSTGTIPLDYLWSEMNNAVTIDNPTNPTITVTEPGIYVLEIMDGNACVDSDQVEVTTDPDLPTMTVESTSPACVGDTPGSISITNIVGGLAPYQFSIDQGVTWTTDEVFSNVAAGDYTVILEDANGCLFNAFATVSPAANPIVSLENDLTISLGESYTITNIDLNFIEDDVANMIWTADGVEIYNGTYIAELLVTPEETAVEYCVFITDVNGCSTEDCIIVRTQQISSVYLPTIISTNSESQNNSFFVQSPYVEAVTTFSVFDRWGERIFSIDEDMAPNVASEGWFGTFKDKRVVEGVYVYFIEVRYVEGITPAEEAFTGTITVIH